MKKRLVICLLSCAMLSGCWVSGKETVDAVESGRLSDVTSKSTVEGNTGSELESEEAVDEESSTSAESEDSSTSEKSGILDLYNDSSKTFSVLCGVKTDLFRMKFPLEWSGVFGMLYNDGDPAMYYPDGTLGDAVSSGSFTEDKRMEMLSMHSEDSSEYLSFDINAEGSGIVKWDEFVKERSAKELDTYDKKVAVFYSDESNGGQSVNLAIGVDDTTLVEVTYQGSLQDSMSEDELVSWMYSLVEFI